jgi:hypothetical protein
MAVVKKVNQKLKVDINTSIKYQILTYCFFKGLWISNTELNMLSELAKEPNTELTIFCRNIADKEMFGSEQSARNAINKMAKKGLISKDGKNKKTISLLEDINVQTDGIVLLDIKILGSESEKV